MHSVVFEIKSTQPTQGQKVELVLKEGQFGRQMQFTTYLQRYRKWMRKPHVKKHREKTIWNLPCS